MRHRSLLIVTTAVATGALTLTACGSRDSGGSGSGSGGGTNNTVVTIGVETPLTEESADPGLGIRWAAQIAVDDANAQHTVPGVTFRVKALDDKGQPGIGQQNATQLVGDKDVVGVIGPLNSAVAQSEEQVFASADMAEISPAATNPTLSMGKNWETKPQRPFKTFFRNVTTDAVQGGFAAQYATQDLHKKKVYLVDDQQAYGVGLVGQFKPEFTKLGGTIAGQDHINVGDHDFTTLTTKIKNSGADMVFYGGQYNEAGPLAKQLRSGGANIPLMGGDGIFSATYIKTAGKGSEGDLATSVGVPIDTVKAAQDFIQKYKDKKYPGDYSTYGGSTYDATTALIKAIGTVAKKGKLPSDLTSIRGQVVDAVGKTDLQGITGPVSFDKFGDTTDKQITVYQVKNGAFKAVKTGTFTG